MYFQKQCTDLEKSSIEGRKVKCVDHHVQIALKAGLKLTVVLDYCEAMETYSRIGLLQSYGNLQSYWTTTKLWKLTVVLDYYETMETYSRIGLRLS